MYHFTPNVRFSPAQAWAYALVVCERVFASHGYDLWITSSMDGKHKTDSLHYKGLALDLRTKHVDKQATRDAIVADIKALLSPTYDVLYEDVGKSNEHLHVEYDPKS